MIICTFKYRRRRILLPCFADFFSMCWELGRVNLGPGVYVKDPVYYVFKVTPLILVFFSNVTPSSQLRTTICILVCHLANLRCKEFLILLYSLNHTHDMMMEKKKKEKKDTIFTNFIYLTSHLMSYKKINKNYIFFIFF